jgi:hypothetical protein
LIDIKKLYSQFVIVFLVLFLGSSAFVDPRSWWSIHEVVETYNDGFITHLSWIKTSFYSLAALILVAILNQPSIKKGIKNVFVIGVNKIKAITNVVKTLLN